MRWAPLACVCSNIPVENMFVPAAVRRAPAAQPSTLPPPPTRTLATISAECHRGPAPAIQPSTLRIHIHNETISSVVLGTVESPLVVVGVRSRIPGSHTVDTV